MKNKTKKWKIIFIAAIMSIAVLFTGMTARGVAFYDNPILQFFVRENPFTTPQQETFPILQIFEENCFTQDRIDNIQLTISPEGGTIIITNQEHIQRVWDTISEIKVTTRGAAQAEKNYERIFVDFQFLNPNYNLGIDMFGQIYILGQGPFVFEEGYCGQPFIHLFKEFSNIRVETTPPERIEECYGIEIVVEPSEDDMKTVVEPPKVDMEIIFEPPLEDIPNDLDFHYYPPTEHKNMLNYTTFIELLEANGFIVEEGQEFPGGTIMSPLSILQRVIYVDGEMIRIEIYDSKEAMERASALIGVTSVGSPEYPNHPTFQITWDPESSPRWFKRDLIIVFYSGHESHLLDFLMENLEFFQGFDF